ncbi:hypothetical protein Goari_012516 [Gossypium aridum]|uniref:Uncharacterized protein n=1 Tax=Gossypium aridum TaxID=34290 RepID=A0A7J8X0R2_GOSAI|nr:hypothetical protein [Gossypium aridum]
MRDNDCLLDSFCYNIMIQGFLRNSYTSKATQLLTEMVRVFLQIYQLPPYFWILSYNLIN